MTQQCQDQQGGKLAYGDVAEQKLPDPRGQQEHRKHWERRASSVDLTDLEVAQDARDHIFGRVESGVHIAIGLGVTATEEAVGDGQHPARSLLIRQPRMSDSGFPQPADKPRDSTDLTTVVLGQPYRKLGITVGLSDHLDQQPAMIGSAASAASLSTIAISAAHGSGSASAAANASSHPVLSSSQMP